MITFILLVWANYGPVQLVIPWWIWVISIALDCHATNEIVKKSLFKPFIFGVVFGSLIGCYLLYTGEILCLSLLFTSSGLSLVSPVIPLGYL